MSKDRGEESGVQRDGSRQQRKGTYDHNPRKQKVLLDPVQRANKFWSEGFGGHVSSDFTELRAVEMGLKPS